MSPTALRALGLGLLLALSACIPPRQVLLPALGQPVPELRDFPPDYTPPRSAETELPMPGFGGGESSGVYRTPVIFVHGNTVSARYWLPAREYFLAQGYGKDELWALGHGWDHVHYFDSNDLSVASIDRIVNSVMDYLSKRRGVPVRQVDIISHSLGVTLVRQWMMQTNSFHRVRNFIGAAGGNHGVWTASAYPRGQQRAASWELAPGSPWLAQLNRLGETPGPTRYMTLYDGSGWGDVFYPKPYQDSPALDGAYNLAFNRERGRWFDHMDLPREPATMDAMLKFLADSGEPLPRARAPRVLRSGDRLRPEPASAGLHCAAGGQYPQRSTPAVQELSLGAESPVSCFALDPQSGLASPLLRFARQAGYRSAGEPTLTATPAGGVYAQAQEVRLESSDPAAFITYTTSGTAPASGSALYQAGHPIYIAAPLRLQAVAITPDGRQSKPLVLDFDISLEKEEAMYSLERQLDPTAPEQYAGRRGKGR
ncbi:MAG: chitobiase/beta-hexosaminidase C-terminal domain-containing protein [Stagnimonas sp.]|nr:chitobiase/beta-hexosaminidase C-terminal domain-containing protein [Stagnimonas sp.]